MIRHFATFEEFEEYLQGLYALQASFEAESDPERGLYRITVRDIEMEIVPNKLIEEEK